MKNLFAAPALSLLLCLIASQLSADDRRVVVELYTSQGCSSCPPADELLHRLSKRDDVIALSLHVDYWDYIGWKDIFGRPEHTDRQKAYARVAGSRTIYTPQMVIGGVDHIVGAHPMDVMETLDWHKSQPAKVKLTAKLVDGTVTISAPPANGIGETVVQLVRFVPEASVAIRRGENAGRTLTYANIVTAWEIIGTWTGEQPLEISAPVSGEEQAVAILQLDGHRAILAADLVD